MSSWICFFLSPGELSRSVSFGDVASSSPGSTCFYAAHGFQVVLFGNPSCYMESILV